MSNYKSLESSILKTLAYFNIFDYPLTLVEIWRYLYQAQKTSLLEVEKILQESQNLREIIETQKGFYFFKGRSELIDKRLERYYIANKKFKKARKITKLLRFVPFINLIAACNNLSYNNAREKSDIDLFLIVSAKRIWTARFYSFLILKILGQRPKKNGENKDKICISVFVSQDGLDLRNLMIDSEDIHFVYWLSQFVPLYDRKNFWQKFVDSNNWLKEYLANNYFYHTHPRRLVKNFESIKKIKEFFHFGFWGDFCERTYKKIQLKILPGFLKKMANQNTNVLITDKVLKFHSNDRREEYRKKYLQKLKDFDL